MSAPANPQTRPPAFDLQLSPVSRWTIFAILALYALAVRLPRLDERPMHTDEAVHAYTMGDLLAGESFRYDPRDFHGPVLYLLAEPLARLCGARTFSDLTETQLRLAPAIVGSATVLLFGAGVEMFGFIACFVAALLFVAAPLPVYYSRYFIHETLFVAATLALILCGWRALKGGSVWMAALAGLCAALLLGCKETASVHFFALAVAVAAGWIYSRACSGRREESLRAETVGQRTHTSAQSETGPRIVSWKAVAVAFAVFVVVTVLSFTWFGRNWQALVDLCRAVFHSAARAGGQGHEKPFGYYFSVLDPTCIFFLLALIGVYFAIRDAVAGVLPPTGSAGILPAGFGRLRGAGGDEPTRRQDAGAPSALAVYALAVFLVYSAIPYKMPWLALNLWLPLALLCGLAIQGIWGRLKGANSRWIVSVAVGALVLFLGYRTKVLAFDKAADEQNPLAYAHTVEDLLRLPPRLAQLAEEEHLNQPVIAVVAADPWPLPWYLRKFQRVGFWQPGQTPPKADFYITSPEAAEGLGDRLKDWRPRLFGIRPEVLVFLWSPPEASP